MAEAEPPEEWPDERRQAFREALRERRARQVRAGQLFALALIALVAGGFRRSARWRSSGSCTGS
jgi:hypothetical protein